MYYECRHILHNGARCHSPALSNGPYCYFHARLHNQTHQARSAAKAKSAPPAAPTEFPLIEDRSAILVAISRVINDLTSKKIDRQTASVLLYSLQIATQNVERKYDVLPFRAVQFISHSKEGDELAPELQVCEPDDDCDACPRRPTCPDFKDERESDES